MRLSDFIQDTLYEIALGVQLAQARSKDLVAINPSRLDGELLTEKSFLDFDVSIVVNDVRSGKKEGSGKLSGEIKVASIAKVSAEIGGKATQGSENTTAQTHRAAFKVPVYMNANFKDNPAAAEHAQLILATNKRSSNDAQH